MVSTHTWKPNLTITGLHQCERCGVAGYVDEHYQNIVTGSFDPDWKFGMLAPLTCDEELVRGIMES